MGGYHEIAAPVLKIFKITTIIIRATTIQVMTSFDKEFISIVKGNSFDCRTSVKRFVKVGYEKTYRFTLYFN